MGKNTICPASSWTSFFSFLAYYFIGYDIQTDVYDATVTMAILDGLLHKF
jgi:hypothetical protein